MITRTENRQKGIDALNRKLGPLETERFIANLLKDPEDYTSWRKTLWTKRTTKDISAAAMAMRRKAGGPAKRHVKKHPLTPIRGTQYGKND